MRIPGAYKAVPGPDGLLAFGGSHSTTVRFPDGRTISTPGSCAGWSGRDVVVSRGVELAPHVYGRELVFVNVDTLREWSGRIDPATNPGWFPQIAHINDITVSSIDGAHFVNGQAIPTEPGAGKIEDFDGEHILYVVQIGYEFTLVVKRLSDGQFIHRVPYSVDVPITNGRIDLLPDGPWLSANSQGRMLAWAPTFGPDWLAPQYGPDGEGRGIVTERNGQIIMVTTLSEGWTPLWLARPLSEWRKDAPAWIVRDVGHQGMILQDGLAYGYVEAYQGRLDVEPVNFDAPRELYTPPKPTLPSITVPPLPPMLVGYLAVGAPGNTGAAGSGKPFIIEGYRQNGDPWFKDSDPLDVIYVDLKESKQPAKMLAHAKAEQEKRRNWLVFYSDSHLVADDHNGDLWTLAEARKCKAEGRPVLLGIRCYLSGPQDTAEAVNTRVLSEVLEYRHEFPLVLFIAAYNQSGNWSDAEVILTIGKMSEFLPSANIRGLLFFGWERPPVIPEINAAAQAVCDAVPLPNRAEILPSWPLPKPIEPPIFTQPVDPPVVKRKRRFFPKKVMR